MPPAPKNNEPWPDLKPLVDRRIFTEEEFVNECGMAAFMGAYKFWTQIEGIANPATRTLAAGVLNALARLNWERNGRCARTPQEREAFAFFGLQNLQKSD